MVAKKPAPTRRATSLSRVARPRPAARKPKSLVAVFDRDRETPNKVVFKERADTAIPISGSFYLDKKQVAALGDPSTIRLTITADGSA